MESATFERHRQRKSVIGLREAASGVARIDLPINSRKDTRISAAPSAVTSQRVSHSVATGPLVGSPPGVGRPSLSSSQISARQPSTGRATATALAEIQTSQVQNLLREVFSRLLRAPTWRNTLDGGWLTRVPASAATQTSASAGRMPSAGFQAQCRTCGRGNFGKRNCSRTPSLPTSLEREANASQAGARCESVKPGHEFALAFSRRAHGPTTGLKHYCRQQLRERKGQQWISSTT